MNLSKSCPVDRENISITGFSMGGAGVWAIAAAYPNMFSRIAPLSGGMKANEAMLSALSKLHVWAFVGSGDTVVNPENTIGFMNRLAERNPQAKLTIFEDAGHTEVPALAYLDREIGLVDWLIGA